MTDMNENLNKGIEKEGVRDVINEEEAIKSNANAPSVISNNISAPAVPNSDDFSEIAEAVKYLDNMKTLAKVFIGGGLCAIKNESDFIIAIITGKQLGLPYTTSVNNIFPIKGKPAMSVHLMRALLLQKGVFFSKDYDYEPMYAYYEAETDETTGKLVAKKLADKAIQRGVETSDKIDETKFVAGRKEVDRITQYTFKRMLKQLDGSYKELVLVSKFRMSDAATAGLLDGKDNWSNFPARMCDARAFATGSRECASDILFGMMSINELADANGVAYTITDSLEEEVIQDAEIVR